MPLLSFNWPSSARVVHSPRVNQIGINVRSRSKTLACQETVVVSHEASPRIGDRKNGTHDVDKGAGEKQTRIPRILLNSFILLPEVTPKIMALTMNMSRQSIHVTNTTVCDRKATHMAPAFLTDLKS
jgi:hypothetical protein